MKNFCFINIGISFGLLSVAPFLATTLFVIAAVGIIYSKREDLR